MRSWLGLLVAVVLAAVAVLCCCTAPVSAALPYSIFQQVVSLAAIAVDSQGHIFVATGAGASITEYDSTGNRLAVFNSTTAGQVNLPFSNVTAINPVSLAFSHNGQLWEVDGTNLRLLDFASQADPLTSSQVTVLDTAEAASIAFQPNAATNDPWLLFPLATNPVQRLSAVTGDVLVTLNTSSNPALSAYGFTALDVDADGNLYLAAVYPSYAIYPYLLPELDEIFVLDFYEAYFSLAKVSPDGTVLWLVNVTDANPLEYLIDLAVSASGDVYGSTATALFRFSGTNGSQLASVPITADSIVGGGILQSLAIDPLSGSLVAGSTANVVIQYSTPDLTVQSAFFTNSTGSQLDPGLVSISSLTGIVYEAVGADGSIERIAPDGTDLGPFGGNVTTGGSYSITVDAQDNVFVLELTNQTSYAGVVQKLSPAGDVLLTFNDQLYPLYFRLYSPVAVNNNNGQVLVLNSGPLYSPQVCNWTVFASDATVVSRYSTDGCGDAVFTSTNQLVYADGSLNGGSVVIADSTTGVTLSSFNYSEAWNPYWLAITPDDRLFVVDNGRQVIEFDLQGRILSVPVPASLNLAPNVAAYSPLNNLLYVTAFSVSGVVTLPVAPPATSTVLGGTTAYSLHTS